MDKINYLFVLLIGVLLFVSCKEDNFINSIEDGPNLAAFTENSQSVSQIADGSEYEIGVPIKLEGPSLDDVSGDIDVTIQPDYSGIPDSVDQAEEGTNFRLDNNTVTLKESNNYLGKFTFTMVTDGIPAPQSPKFNLKATDASGSGNVINSGKPIELTLNYACDSNLQGTYNVTVTRDDGSVFEYEDEQITQREGLGQYVGETIGSFRAGGGQYRPNDILEGLTFSDVCGTLTVPVQDLNAFSNEVGGVTKGSVTGNSQTGDLTSFTLEYYIVFGGEQTKFKAVYTKQ